MFLWRTIRASEDRMWIVCVKSWVLQAMCFVLPFIAVLLDPAENITVVNAEIIMFTTCEDCGGSGMIHKSSAASYWWYFTRQKTSRLSSSCMPPSRASHISSGWLIVLTSSVMSHWSIYYNSGTSVNRQVV